MTEKQQSVTTESVTTVIIAGGANLAIAIAKVIAGVISGSASMLSEAAHSFADTTTEVLLYIALRRSVKPAFVWALIAAAFTLVAGAGFSITHGIHTIRNLVAAKVDFVDTVTAADVEAACALAEQRLRAALPTIRYVFLSPMGSSS